MNIATKLGLKLGAQDVILVGTPEITSILDSENQPYYTVKVKDPVLVRCSVDKEILPFETEEVLVREADLNSDGWSLVDEGDESKGFFRAGWVVDFSKGQGAPIYQAESIRKWAKDNRGDKRSMRVAELNAGIKAKLEAKKS